MMHNARQNSASSFFMEIFMIAAWLIWKQRNDYIFNRGQPTINSWKFSFLQEAALQTFRLQPDKKLLFKAQLDLYR
jgi:hypothetical protein